MRLVTGQSTILQRQQLFSSSSVSMVGERTLHLPIGRRKTSATKSLAGEEAVSTPATTSAVEESPIKNTATARGGFFSSGLRSPGAVLRRSTYPHKKPLGPSLSWDPSQKRRSRSTSNSPRLRIHSDGTEEVHEDNGEPHGLELEHSCLHCSLASELKKRQLKNEIESAVKRLARRLGTGGSKPSSWPRVNSDSLDPQKRAQLGTPDIVVSSVSSDEDTDPGMGRQTSSDIGSMPTSGASTPTSSTSASPRAPIPCNGDTRGGFFVGDRMSMENSRECLSPVVVVNSGETEEGAGEQSQRATTKAMDCLMPPGPVGLCLNPDSNSPPRSNSVDLSTLRRDIELLSISSGDSEYGSDMEFDPGSSIENLKTCRSKSHDPAPSPDLLLRRPSRIEHLSELFRKALAKSPVVRRNAAMHESEQQRCSNKHRTSHYWLDTHIDPAEHIWLPSTGPGSAANTSTDSECYIGEKDCLKMGEKSRCAACHIVAHSSCFALLTKMNLNCKITFRDSSMKQQTKEMSDATVKHHWVHRWKHEGRCQQCGKSFQQRMFREKEVIAIACSWCKQSYHNKPSCYTIERLDENCNRGALSEMVVPPDWVIRLTGSTRKRVNNAGAAKRKRQPKKYRPFVVKALDASIPGPSQPLLVFVNPKSGGNKGSKALHTLCWLLNPRQVFDITALKGPKYGLEMYRKVVSQLRLLVCGGDGTVGWVLATLDQLNWAAYPPMALLPLGTGNDLSRCMGWGGAFTDEPLSELLGAILTDTTVTYLDRWRLDVQPNTNSDTDFSDVSEPAQSSLPLTVMNNYFSIGADAHVALQFHQSRSANPQMLNSRFKNRIAYGGLGTIDLFKRSWRDLSDFMTLECDGVDLTNKIKEFKFHCILVHNISYYAGGTMPWPHDMPESFSKPSCCDGKVEVLGFTTATLAALQMGGKGEPIAQCSTVKVVTRKAIPMQVDGEPCMLAPSFITMHFHSKVPMLRREKKSGQQSSTPAIPRRPNAKQSRSPQPENSLPCTSVILQIPVLVVGRHDYDSYRDAIDRLKDTAFEVGFVSVEAETELDQARLQIQRLLSDHPCLPYEPDKDWRFLDYVTNAEEGTFRVSRHQEHIHSVSDVCNLDECLMLLDEAFPSMTTRGSTIGADLLFAPPRPRHSQTANRPRRRRISETLRIVLSSDSKETHL